MPKRALKLDTLTHKDLEPQDCPIRALPDYEALYRRMVDNGGWTVLRTNPSEDRRTASGAWESPLVKAFNGHVRTVLKQPLYTRRVAVDTWYMELGSTEKDDQ
jgi:hypothetical protein